MSETLRRVQTLVLGGDYEISRHGILELASDGIMLGDVIMGIGSAVAIEDYPAARHGPSVLALQYCKNSAAIHVVWGIPKSTRGPAVLVTAYVPDPERWSDDLKRRKR